MNLDRRFTAIFTVFLAALAAGAVQTPAQQPAADPLHAWVQGSDPAALEAWVNARLDEEKADVAKLVAVQGPRTLKNTTRRINWLWPATTHT